MGILSYGMRHLRNLIVAFITFVAPTNSYLPRAHWCVLSMASSRVPLQLFVSLSPVALVLFACATSSLFVQFPALSSLEQVPIFTPPASVQRPDRHSGEGHAADMVEYEGDDYESGDDVATDDEAFEPPQEHSRCVYTQRFFPVSFRVLCVLHFLCVVVAESFLISIASTAMPVVAVLVSQSMLT